MNESEGWLVAGPKGVQSDPEDAVGCPGGSAVTVTSGGAGCVPEFELDWLEG